VILLIEGFYHTDAPDIFLHYIVEHVVGAKNAAKQRPDLADDQKQQHRHDGNDRKEDERKGRVDAEGHDHGEDQHDRAANCHADEHLIGILQVGHIGGEAGHDGRCGELINVGKGKGLHIVVHILPQIGGKAHRGFCGNVGGKHAGQQL